MYKTEDDFDGAAIQASTDFGVTWANIGTIGTGTNWYTKKLPTDPLGSPVLAFTGGNGDSWSGESAGIGYVTATNEINGLNGKTHLLLRVAFGADSYLVDEGFAFDNIKVTPVKVNQTIAFAALPAKQFGDAPFDLTATSTSGLAVSFASSDNTVASITGKTVTILKVGTVDITASQAGDGNYNAAPVVKQTLVIGKRGQTISFSPILVNKLGDPPFDLTAFSTSGLAVSFTSSDNTVASITGNKVTILKAGTVEITASQAGDANYNAAPAVKQSLAISQKGNQTITFSAIPAKKLGDPPFDLTATSTSGLAVSFASSDITVASIMGKTVTLLKAGLVKITASQTGDGSYNASPDVERSFCVNPPKPQVTLSSGLTASPTLTSSNASGNQWYLDGVALPGETGATLSATKLGKYSVKTTIEGCESLASDDLNLIVTGDLPSASTKNELVVYPNPVTKANGAKLTLILGGFENKELDVAIHDMLGKQVERFKARGGEQVEIDLSHFPDGSYVTKVVQGTKKASIKFSKAN
jgi:hypothetical protein